MDLLEMLSGQLGGEAIGQIGQQLGTDRKTAGNATAAGLSALIGALSRNASAGDGARSLDNALQRDHDGSVLDDVAGFLGRGDASPGEAILKHVLGGRRGQVEAGLSQTTGLDKAGAGKLLAMLAPMVLGALGKARKQNNMDAGALSGFLGQQREQISRRDPASAGLLDRLLDTDGDGDFDLGDAAKHGVGLLGKLFDR